MAGRGTGGPTMGSIVPARPSRERCPPCLCRHLHHHRLDQATRHHLWHPLVAVPIMCHPSFIRATFLPLSFRPRRPRFTFKAHTAMCHNLHPLCTWRQVRTRFPSTSAYRPRRPLLTRHYRKSRHSHPRHHLQSERGLSRLGFYTNVCIPHHWRPPTPYEDDCFPEVAVPPVYPNLFRNTQLSGSVFCFPGSRERNCSGRAVRMCVLWSMCIAVPLSQTKY